MAATTIAKDLVEVARFFDVSLSSVQKWRAAGMPGKKGHYDLGRISRWLFVLGPWKSDVARDDMLRESLTEN